MSIYKFFTAPTVPKSEPNESKSLLFVVGVIIGAIAISTGTGGAVKNLQIARSMTFSGYSAIRGKRGVMPL